MTRLSETDKRFREQPFTNAECDGCGDLIEQAVKQERERCAKIAEDFRPNGEDGPHFRIRTVGACIAVAIRRGGAHVPPVLVGGPFA